MLGLPGVPPGGRRGRGPLPAAAEEEEEDEEGEEGDGGDPPAAQQSRGCEARIALCSREVVGVTSHPALAASGGAGDSPVPKLQPPPARPFCSGALGGVPMCSTRFWVLFGALRFLRIGPGTSDKRQHPPRGHRYVSLLEEHDSAL